MSLRTTIANDATAVFCNTSDFAETITYSPYGGSPRSIAAVVMREQAQEFAPDGGTTSLPVWQICVANDGATGVGSAEINVGRDKLTFPPRDNENPVAKTITSIIFQDHGMLVVECR